MTLKELREKQKNILTLARQKLDEIKDDTPEVRAKEIEAEHDRAMADYDKLGEQISRMQKLEDAEARANDEAKGRRPKGEDRSVRGSEDDEHKFDDKKVFKRLMQYGMDGLPPEERSYATKFVANLSDEQRALGIATGAAGGFSVAQEFSNEIDVALKAYGPMFDPGVTRVLTTANGADLPWPTLDDTGNIGALLTENTAAAEQDVALSSLTLKAYMYTSKMVRVSLQLLTDSAFNVGSEILDPAFGERLGRIGNNHLTLGTGAGAQPNGIVTAATLGKTTAAVAAVTADEIIDFYHSVDPAYRKSPKFRFMMNDSTLLAVRKLKDTQNRYLIDGLSSDGGTLNLAGISVPYSINQDMAVMATAARFMLAGDFNKYVVRRVNEYTLLRLAERYAEFLQVAFLGFARFDGNLLNTAAVKYMRNA